MRTNMQRFLGLCIVLCLGLTSACVHVDVSVTSRNPPLPPYPPIKPSISMDDLKKRHAKSCDPSSSNSKDVAKEQQQTAAWCWATSTRMVMDYHNKHKTPPQPTALQCDIVRNIFSPRIGGTNCCEREITPDFIDAPSKCVRGGWPHWVFDKYHFNYETVAGPLDWNALTGEICSVGPFISVIAWSGGGKHSFVVKGYRPPSSSSLKVVEVYDPILDDPQDMTFEEFVGDSPREQYGFHRFSHYLNFVQIWPKAKDEP